MGISIRREKNERGVKVGSLKVGDTFLYDNRVGVVVERNGHVFFLDLSTCGNFRNGNRFSGELKPEDTVLPIEVKMTYKVVG